MNFGDALDVFGEDDVAVLLVTGNNESVKQEDIALSIDDLPVRGGAVGDLEVVAPLEVGSAFLHVELDAAFVDFDAFELAALLHHHHVLLHAGLIHIVLEVRGHVCVGE